MIHAGKPHQGGLLSEQQQSPGSLTSSWQDPSEVGQGFHWIVDVGPENAVVELVQN